MSSLASLAGESPDPDDRGESQHDGNNAAIPGEESGSDDNHGESRSLAELLDEGQDGDGKPGSESAKPPAKRLIDLAETLKIKPDDLYKLEVALSGGKSMKIGELKDLAQKATDYEAANLELETRRQEQESRFAQMHGELRELVSSLPETARKTEAMEKAAQRWQAKVEKARKDVDASIVEWKDADVRKADREQMAEYLKAYGFEDGYLEKILDPRSMRLIRDATRLHKRVTEALTKLKRAGPGKKPSGTRPASGHRREAPARDSRVATPANAAYDALLDTT